MKPLAFAILLVACSGCRPKREPMHVNGVDALVKKPGCNQFMVYVYESKEHKILVPVYADNRAYIPMTNPFLTDCNGSANYYTNRSVYVESKRMEPK